MALPGYNILIRIGMAIDWQTGGSKIKSSVLRILYSKILLAIAGQTQPQTLRNIYLNFESKIIILKQKLTFLKQSVSIICSASCVPIVASVWNNYIFFWLFNTFHSVFWPQLLFWTAELIDISAQIIFSRAKLIRDAL